MPLGRRRIAGKRFIVTGASSGVGRAIAFELAHRGAHGVVDSLALFFADFPIRHYFDAAAFIRDFTKTLSDTADKTLIHTLVEHISRPNNVVAKIIRTRLTKFVFGVLDTPMPTAADTAVAQLIPTTMAAAAGAVVPTATTVEAAVAQPPHGFPVFVDPIVTQFFTIVAPANRVAHLNCMIHSALYTSFVETALHP
jgi:hypothetical protein